MFCGLGCRSAATRTGLSDKMLLRTLESLAKAPPKARCFFFLATSSRNSKILSKLGVSRENATKMPLLKDCCSSDMLFIFPTYYLKGDSGSILRGDAHENLDGVTLISGTVEASPKWQGWNGILALIIAIMPALIIFDCKICSKSFLRPTGNLLIYINSRRSMKIIKWPNGRKAL